MCMQDTYVQTRGRYEYPLLGSPLLSSIHHPHARPDSTAPHSILVEILVHLTL
jgi:hypothetical protein